MGTTIYYVEVKSLDGKTYGVQAVAIDPGDGGRGGYAPHVSILDANGEPVKTVVDSENTDEAYDDPRDCLYRAMQHVF